MTEFKVIAFRPDPLHEQSFPVGILVSSEEGSMFLPGDLPDVESVGGQRLYNCMTRGVSNLRMDPSTLWAHSVHFVVVREGLVE